MDLDRFSFLDTILIEEKFLICNSYYRTQKVKYFKDLSFPGIKDLKVLELYFCYGIYMCSLWESVLHIVIQTYLVYDSVQI